ncbi:MAG: tetratricopeptide repeat protein, partial [Dehalococcoidales bacterium]
MDSSLLATKFHIPQLRPGQVDRPHLLEQLQDSLNYRLVLISAPAGFGKTTLLSEWIHNTQSSVPIAWVSLGDEENDPRRFWEYLITAIQTIEPTAGETLLPMLRSTQLIPIEGILTPLINDMTSISEDFILILDDYHFIHTSAIHQGLTYFLEHMPLTMHLIISTRSDPPLPLARFRGKGTLLEIGEDDLRFSLEETANLLREMGISRLSSNSIDALNNKAEGWIAGLKMAILAMKGKEDLSAYISDFTGSQKYVMDYLIEEVLQQQSAEVRDFLVKTSILEKLNRDLCNSVTERSDSQDILLKLDQDNLFIIQLDESRDWYRYHHLFRDLLQHRLKIEYEDDDVRNLHLKSSHWHEHNGYIEEAINHSLASQKWENAIDLIRMPVIQTHVVRTLTMLTWLKQIPEELLRNDFPLYMNYIWALEGTGHYSEAEDCLLYLEEVHQNDKAIQGMIAVVRANNAIGERDFSSAEEYAKKALSLLPQDHIGVDLISGTLSGLYLLQNRWAEAEPLVKRNYEFMRRSGYIPSAVQMLTYIGLITFLKGELYRAVEIYEAAIELAKEHPISATHVGIAHHHLGGVYYELNNLEQAAYHHQRAIELYKPSVTFGSMQLDWTYLHLARTYVAMGDFDRAIQSLETADQLLNKNDPVDRARNAAYHSAIALAMDDETSVSKWIDDLMGLDVTNPIVVDLPVQVYYFLDKKADETRAADRHTEEYEHFSSQGLNTLLIKTRTLQALNSNDSDVALDYIADALRLAKENGHIRVIVDLGISLAPLLREAVSINIEKAYSRKLLDIIETEERQRKIRKAAKSTSPLTPGILSERELEVLKLVA